jgi:hypothetical protein
MLRKHREVVSFPEKGSEVSGQRVYKSLPLGAILVRFQHAQVATKIIQPKGTQATNQAVIDHVPLMVGEHDPCTLIDQLTYSTKMRVRQRKTLSHLLHE